MNLGRLCQIILKSDKEISGYGQLAQHAIFALSHCTANSAHFPTALPWSWAFEIKYSQALQMSSGSLALCFWMIAIASMVQSVGLGMQSVVIAS